MGRFCRSFTSTATKSPTPTVLARISHEELDHLFRGYGYTPYFVEGHEPAAMHELMAATLDTVIGEIQRIQADARRNGFTRTPALADDRPAHAQGLDLPERDRRQAHRGLLARASGADGRDAREPGPCAHPRRVDEELPAGRSCSTTAAGCGRSWPIFRRRACAA